MNRLAVTLSLLLSASVVHAWDTAEDTQEPKIPWHAAYLGVVNVPGASHVWNEHTYISDIALRRIGAAEWLGIGGVSSVTTTDLNSSVFRHEKRGFYLQDVKGDDPQTLLEERLIPTPSHFTGLPDYSYTVYDWANKSAICPVNIAGYKHLCHVFAGWMGALNANHFGSQATATYRRYHEIALAQAQKAQTVRNYIVDSMSVAALSHYRKYLREIEAEAFVFEAVAQHYLQDRWSTGHMWERWNGSDLKNAHSIFWVNFLVGDIAGLIHGSESLARPIAEYFRADEVGLDKVTLDMLNSPQIVSETEFDPAWWKFGSGDGQLHPGVGDKRLLDMLTNTYNGNPLDVDQQESRMFECFSASWASVIRAVGKHPVGVGYGMDNIILNANSPTFDPSTEGHYCTDVWVTNDSIYRAWLDDFIVKLLKSAGIDLDDLKGDFLLEAVKIAISKSGMLSEEDSYQFVRRARWEIVGLTARLELQRRLDKRLRVASPNDFDSTSLAKGAIDSFAGRGTGEKYPLASWLEPSNLDALPALDDRFGRDKQSLFGLFSRAHIDNWCEQPDEIFGYVRPSTSEQPEMHLAACTFVADMMYQGTTEGYGGPSQEIRTTDGSEDAPPVLSFCRLNKQSDLSYQPIYLSPGYVSFDPARAGAGAYERVNDIYRSVYNWCRRVPVLSLVSDNEEPDLIGNAEPGELLRLTGENLGEEAGRIELTGYHSGTDHEVFDLSAEIWTEHLIEVDVPTSVPLGSYCARVIRSDEVASEGRFVLEISGTASDESADLALSVGESTNVIAEIFGRSAGLTVVPSSNVQCPIG